MLLIFPQWSYGESGSGIYAEPEPKLARAQPAAVVKSAPLLRFESRLPGHVDSMWRHFQELYEKQSEVVVGFESQNADASEFNSDIVELTLHDAISACDQGEINLLPYNSILSERNQLDAYIWNAIQPCAIGHSVWADVIVFDQTRYVGESAPVLLDDFFNIEAFPGKRALNKSPRVIAEWAMLNKGVSRQDIYAALAGDNAWEWIEDSLQLLGPEIHWVDTDEEVLALVDSGAVTFGVVSSPSLVRQISQNKSLDQSVDHYGVIWHKSIAHMSLLAVPKRSATTMNADRLSSDELLGFLQFVTEPLRNLQLSTSLGYAPVNDGHTVLIDRAYRRALPVNTQADNLVWSNDKWWRENGRELERKFTEYMERPFVVTTAQNS